MLIALLYYFLKNCRLGQKDFIKIRDQIVELFKTEHPDIWYTPPLLENGESVAANGSLLNFYKRCRTELYKAGIILSLDSEDDDLTGNNSKII